MGLSDLFGGGSEITKVNHGSLAPASKASINDRAAGFLKDYAKLPTKTTQQEVVKAANMGGSIEAQNALLKALSRNRLNIINQSINTLQTQASYHTGVLKAQNRYAQLMANTGKQISQTKLEHAQLTANYKGYATQFESGVAEAEMIIDIG